MEYSNWDAQQTETIESGVTGATQQPYSTTKYIKFGQKLWDTSIYAREQAIIASNSLTDQCTANSVTASSLENTLSRRYPEEKQHLKLQTDTVAPARHQEQFMLLGLGWDTEECCQQYEVSFFGGFMLKNLLVTCVHQLP
ncbi:MAG: hypothetical protein EZS28_018037 [Streblomastix strix]|uniref:Uncharacterized protein n=1 Tax=Streblomastix strix TaxID=222440 RepID=A0A5J4VUW3_9EUKA|nr:MAG: hypothetical protein EZS28_018037 [Streblomastix strix]